MSAQPRRSVAAHLAAVEQADHAFDDDRTRVRQHAGEWQRSARTIVRPMAWTAAGIAVAAWLLARRRRSRVRRQPGPAPASAHASPFDTLMRAMNLAAAAMPILMPLIARHSAEKAVEAVAPAAVRRDHAVH